MWEYMSTILIPDFSVNLKLFLKIVCVCVEAKTQVERNCIKHLYSDYTKESHNSLLKSKQPNIICVDILNLSSKQIYGWGKKHRKM